MYCKKKKLLETSKTYKNNNKKKEDKSVNFLHIEILIFLLQKAFT